MAKGQSKYLNQTKTVNGIAYSTIEYKNSKLKIVADGYKGELWVVTSTWKNYDDNSTTTKRSSSHPESKRFKETFTKIVEKVVEVVEEITDTVKKTLQNLVDDLNAFDDYVMNVFCDIVDTKGEKGLKRAYKELSKIYHPDVCKHQNTHELMKIINEYYHGFMFM